MKPENFSLSSPLELNNLATLTELALESQGSSVANLSQLEIQLDRSKLHDWLLSKLTTLIPVTYFTLHISQNRLSLLGICRIDSSGKTQLFYVQLKSLSWDQGQLKVQVEHGGLIGDFNFYWLSLLIEMAKALFGTDISYDQSGCFTLNLVNMIDLILSPQTRLPPFYFSPKLNFKLASSLEKIFLKLTLQNAAQVSDRLAPSTSEFFPYRQNLEKWMLTGETENSKDALSFLEQMSFDSSWSESLAYDVLRRNHPQFFKALPKDGFSAVHYFLGQAFLNRDFPAVEKCLAKLESWLPSELVFYYWVLLIVGERGMDCQSRIEKLVSLFEQAPFFVAPEFTELIDHFLLDERDLNSIIRLLKTMATRQNDRTQIKIYKFIASLYDRLIVPDFSEVTPIDQFELTEVTVKIDDRVKQNRTEIEQTIESQLLGLPPFFCDRPSMRAYVCGLRAKKQLELLSWESAATGMEEALSIDPSFYPMFRNLRNTLFQKEKYDFAQKCLQIELSFVGSHQNYEFILWEADELLGAIQKLTDAAVTEITPLRSPVFTPEMTHVKTKMAEFFINSDQTLKAVREYEVLLKADPFDLAGYLQLAKLYEENCLFDEAYCTHSAISFLDPKEPDSRDYINRYRAKYTKILPKSISTEQRLTYLLVPQNSPELAAILKAILPITLRIQKREISKIFDPWKTSKKTTSKPIELVFNRVSKFLDAPKINLQIVENVLARTFEYKGFKPPMLVFDKARMKDFSHGKTRFLIAKAIEHAVEGNALYLYLDLREIQKVVNLLGNAVLPEYKDFLTHEQIDSSFGKNLRNVLSPLEEKQLKPLYIKYVFNFRKNSLEQIMNEFVQNANRAGLLAGNDLSEALDFLLFSEPQFDPLDLSLHRIRTLAKFPQIEDLMRFNMSEEFFQLRRLLGIA